MIQNLKVVGIVVAKKHSKRFDRKNIHPVDGKPMYQHALDAIMESDYIDSVVVATDDETIQNYCNKLGLEVIERKVNAIEPEEPLFDVIKFAYKSLDQSYDIIVNVMANSIRHKGGDIDEAIELLAVSRLGEVRSYDSRGIENGLLVLDTSTLTKYELSAYVGMIQTDAKEIHYKFEID